jgi:hypothetical protein
MTAGAFLRLFVRDGRGATAAEFALVLPLALLFFFGIIDAGRLFFNLDRGEKATQIGARWAVVTDPVTPELATTSYVGTTVDGVTLTQGDRIPADALGLITCTQTSCVCTTNPCPSGMTRNGTPFNILLARIRQIMPDVTASNLIVEYRGSGLGYAGDPNGMEISPLVTVRIAGLTFSPLILFGLNVTLPDFSYTLSMEDGQGTESN